MIRQLAHLNFATDDLSQIIDFYVDKLGLKIGTRYRHFCLEVTGLDEFCKELKDKGVQVTDISMGLDNSRQAWIADPDGNQIELMEYGHFSMQLKGS